MTLLLLLGLSAFAFSPDPAMPQGIEPVRLRQYHKEVQYELRQGAGWTDFVRGEGAGWAARFDERTGLPYRAWGPGIALGALNSPQDAASAVIDVLARNPGLIGQIDPADLAVERSKYEASTDTWYVRLGQRVDGVPVWRGAVEARVRFGKLIMLGNTLVPDASAVGLRASITASQATQKAIDAGPVPDIAHEIGGASLVVLPLDDGHDLNLHLAWEVHTSTAWPPGRWVSYVDARTGQLLSWHNEVLFFSGTVTGTHDTRTVNGDFTTSVLPYVTVTGDSGSTTTTDADGEFSLSGDSSGTTALSGTYFRVRNDARGGDGSLSLSGDGTWTDANATQAEIDSYKFLGDVRAWGLEYAPGVSFITDQLTSHVNANSTCNAYYDGNVNFFLDGGGCNNTGRIADVNYHEWGHGFHYYNLDSGVYDSSISEGIGDSVAALQTGDPTIAPYFLTSGGGIREIATDHVYPDDVVGESHEDGLIFAGAVWDLWAELDAEYSGDPETAYDVLSTLFVNGLKGGPEIPDSYDEFISADDDDGDLSNGTPHQCAIVAGFAPHGLGPGGGATLVSLDHTPIANQTAEAAGYAVEAELNNLVPGCVDFTVAEAVVFYSIDGGDTWSSTDLSTDGESVWGEMPAVADGSIVTYYVTMEASDGSQVSAPTGGSINPFSFLVGDFEEIYCEDFEDGEAGYTHDLISGSDELGADDWVWGKPRGASSDPDYASSGDRVWGNDLGGGNYNGEYQNSKHNRLISPAIDVSGYDRVVLQYQRWLNVEDGVYDKASVLANGETVWTNHTTSESAGTEHHEDDQWAPHAVELPVDGTGSLELWWDIESDRGLTFGGWTIDDVCVYGRVASEDPVDTGGDDTGASDDTGSADDSGDHAFDSAPEDGELVIGEKVGGCGCAHDGAGGAGRAGALAGLLVAGLVLLRRRPG